jgi:hypothetical protein
MIRCWRNSLRPRQLAGGLMVHMKLTFSVCLLVAGLWSCGGARVKGGSPRIRHGLRQAVSAHVAAAAATFHAVFAIMWRFRHLALSARA